MKTHMMYDCFLKYLKETAVLDGDIIEVGVYQGESLQMIGAITKELGIKKKMYGVDTFSGMPGSVINGLDNGWGDRGQPTPGCGGHFPGDFADTSFGYVAKIISPYDNILLIQGIFPQCADNISNEKFCFAHVDVDIYQSYKDTYEFLWPRMASGGVIVCGDDYPCPWLPGAKKAIDEAVEKFGVIPVITPKKQHIIRKP